MARLRILLALLLVAVGASIGGLALSGYYEPHPASIAYSQANASAAKSGEGAALARARPRQHFVAAETKTVVTPAPKAKDVKAAPPRDVIVKVRDRRPATQQASAQWQWPWNLFGN
jgi:hypothetical protein